MCVCCGEGGLLWLAGPAVAGPCRVLCARPAAARGRLAGNQQRSHHPTTPPTHHPFTHPTRPPQKTAIHLPPPQVGVTTVIVTHDQEEAFDLADKVVIFNRGFIEQTGSPTEIIRRPATPFVMKFVGDTNDVPSASALVRRSRWGVCFGGARVCFGGRVSVGWRGAAAGCRCAQ